MKIMKIGTLVVNPYVTKMYKGELNPNYITIYIGGNKTIDFNGRVCRWVDKIVDNPNWREVGYFPLLQSIYKAIVDAANAEQEQQEWK